MSLFALCQTCFVCLCFSLAVCLTFYGPDFTFVPLPHAFLDQIQLNCTCYSLSDPPEFSPDQPTQVQVVEDDMATIPLLVSANPEEVSCIWHRREKLVKGDRSRAV